jgi:UDP-N-acetylglucosamine 2-epimerase (non-hydrolysing)
MKVATMLRLMIARPDRFDPILVHTGQHYDANMSDVHFADLGISEPQYHLSVGSGSLVEVNGKTMIAFEEVLTKESPDLVVVFGDVTGTVACAMAAVYLHIPVAHVEAGLRSRDRKMPEEVNRIVTDTLSSFLFTPSRDGDENLIREGVAADRIHFVGNVMVDSLMQAVRTLDTKTILEGLGVSGPFAYCTLHRAGNVDEANRLSSCLDCLERVQAHIPVVFPMHPRTASRIDTYRFRERIEAFPGLKILEPVGYLESLALQKESVMVVSDSAGLQEESTVFGKPCLTMRPNTERPITVEVGSATIVDLDPDLVEQKTLEVMEGRYKTGQVPELWDGKTSERIVDLIDRLV